MSPKAPTARGFTLAEKRSLRFERIALVVVMLVALIAMVVSFVALTWVGIQLRAKPSYAWLFPLMIDGFGVACSVGIIRSQSEGEPGRKRINEWLGLFYALGLSILGNGFHVIGDVPLWFKLGVASAPPVLLAYGLHVYGRAMQKGISAHVMADNPDQLHFDITHLGEDDAQQPARKPAPRTSPARTAPATSVRTPDSQPVRTPAPEVRTPHADETVRTQPTVRTTPTDGDDLQARARALFEEALLEDPSVKPDASAIHKAIDAEHNPATTRRWVARWWDEQQAAAEPQRDPIEDQLRVVKPAQDDEAAAS